MTLKETRAILECLVLLAVLVLGLASPSFAEQKSVEYNASEKAVKLAMESIIVDGHIDVPHRLHLGWEDMTEATEGGDFDYPRAKSGGLNAPFMSIYVPAVLDGTAESTERAHKLIDYVEAMVGRAPDKYAVATSPAEVEQQFAKGLISLPLGMENGAPINGDLENLQVFYDRGIRYITLTHSKSNHISDSSYDETRQWEGLSPFGEEVVNKMNDLGILVDISHVSDEAFYDTVEVSRAPVIASHSSLRTFTPDFERNMDDDMIKALAKNGGVIMINFGSTFLDAKSREWRNTQGEEAKKVQDKYGEDSEEVTAFWKNYPKEHPFPFATLDKVVEHIDYAVKLVGVDHVGLGSDYDGVRDTLPVGLKDVSTYPNLVQGLFDKQYSEADIKKILGGNLLRVWRQVEKVASGK